MNTQKHGVRFAGYAALFDKQDRGGDIIRRGAFARAIAWWRGRGRPVPLLWQHRPDKPIGIFESMAEDARGLRVIGRIDTGAQAAAMLKGGQVNGLSFGYRVATAEGRAPRVLKDLDLIKVSLVTFPMQPQAQVHMVE